MADQMRDGLLVVDVGEPEQDIMLKDENGLVVATLMKSYHEEGERQVMATARGLAAYALLWDALEAILNDNRSSIDPELQAAGIEAIRIAQEGI